MWPFGRDARDRALDVALSQNADLKQQIRDLAEERRRLIDHIVSLTNPGALREVNRQLPGREAEAPTEAQAKSNILKAHRFPGNEVMVLPTRRPEPPNPFPPEPPKSEAS